MIEEGIPETFSRNVPCLTVFLRQRSDALAILYFAVYGRGLLTFPTLKGDATASISSCCNLKRFPPADYCVGERSAGSSRVVTNAAAPTPSHSSRP